MPASGKFCRLQTVWPKTRPDRMTVLIWIKTVWHSDSDPERIFLIFYFEKKINSWQKNHEITQNAKSLSHNVHPKWLLSSTKIHQILTVKKWKNNLGQFMRLWYLSQMGVGNSACFFVVCWFFSKSIFFFLKIRNTIRVLLCST